MSWSKRTQIKVRGNKLLLMGRAYPDVAPGGGQSMRINSNLDDRHAFYHDPAVQLSEHDMNSIDGANGAPICYNHDQTDVIGRVSYSWLAEDASGRRPLDIIASLPLDPQGRVLNKEGRDVRKEIEEGYLNGFSVRYVTDYDDRSMMTKGKLFQEISVVPQPFFKGCDLKLAVVAGQNQRNNGKNVQ